jgi:hypothetical protein
MSSQPESNIEIAINEAEVREQIHDQGYANIAFGLGKFSCDELFSDFKDFIKLCETEGGKKYIEALKFEVNDLGNGKYYLDHKKAGEKNEDQRKISNDHKYVMHYGAQTADRAEIALGKSKLPRQMRQFLEDCEDFYHAGRAAARLGTRALGIDHILMPEDPKKDVHLLRVIDYIASDNEHLGEAHFDRGVTTLAITESSPGLRGVASDNGYLRELLPEDRERLASGMAPVDHHEHVAKFFGAAGLRRLPEKVRRQNDLDNTPLFAHDIVNENPGENRQAVVMFFNPRLGFEPYKVPSPKETSTSF